MSKAQDNIVKHFDKTLRENFIKNIIIGFESANQMILDYAKEDGRTVEDIIEFCNKNLKNKDVVVKTALKERKENK